MNIVNMSFDKFYTLSISVNWVLALIIIALTVLISYGVKWILKKTNTNSITVNEVALGIGSNSITLKYDQKDREIAYKLWVELDTRKISLEFDEENDVIREVYDSWYSSFGIIRELMKEIPANHLDSSSQLIDLTSNVLNKGLRPHLTNWQAKYRKWLKENESQYLNKTPQEVQREYPEYEELVKDLIETNKKMIEYKELLHQIAFK